MWHRYLVWKNCCLPVMRELILHANAVKQLGKALDEGSEYPTGPEEL